MCGRWKKKYKKEVRYTTIRKNRKRTHVERSVIQKLIGESECSTSEKQIQTNTPACAASQNPEEEATVKAPKYSEKKTQRIAEWVKLREALHNIGLSTHNLQHSVCNDCQAEEVAIYRCLDCYSWSPCCYDCLTARHSYPHLHIFQGWNNGSYVQFTTETPLWKLSHSCSSIYEKTVVIVDDKGRQHLRQLCFCLCEPEAATLLRYNLWPSSPKRPQLAFHIDLLKWLHGLQMECHVSVKSFCEALHARLSKHQKGLVTLEVKDVYSILIKETMSEFRHFWYNMENLHSVDAELDDGTSCAACFDVPTRMYSFDADFQLVRKQSAGKSWDNPKHEGHFFLPQQEVDSFMASYDDSAKKGVQIDCNEFQAGSNIRAKIKSAKLSETAVFGSTCRHEVPKYFFSLKHGERLGYAVYLLKKLTEENQDRNIHVLYDIACLLDSHLKKRNDSLSDRVSLSIPIFHCYGHKLACQVLYSPRRTEGMGLTDGESLERLWSYLGKFSRITKEMSPENRIDILAEGLHHYAKKVQAKFNVSLVQKHEKAEKIAESSQKALSELLHPFPNVTGDMVEQWTLDEKTSCSNIESQSDFSFTAQEEYALHMEILENSRLPGSHVDSKVVEKSEKKLQKLEKKLRIKTRPGMDSCRSDLQTAKVKKHRILLSKIRKEACDRTYLLELIKKYARGQGIAVRLQRQIKSCNAGLKKTLILYNDVGEDSSPFPSALSFDDIKKTDASCFRLLDADFDEHGASTIPQIVRRQAIDYQALITRAIEEQELIKTEMLSVINFYKHQHSVLNRVYNLPHDGFTSIIIQDGIATEIKLMEFQNAFRSVIGDVDIPSSFIDLVGFYVPSVTSVVQEIIEAEDIVVNQEEESESDEDEDTEQE